MLRYVLLAAVVVGCGKDRAGPPAATYDETRKAIAASGMPAPTVTALTAAVDDLQKRGNTVIYVTVSADRDSVTAANAWLNARAGAKASEVFPYYASTGRSPGEDELVRGVSDAVHKRAPKASLRFTQLQRERGKEPMLSVDFKVAPTGMFASPGGHRMYATLEATYSLALSIGDAPKVELATGVVVPPGDSVEVVRLKFQGDTLPEIGEQASIHEDSLVYTSMLEVASKEAIPKIIALVFGQ